MTRFRRTSVVLALSCVLLGTLGLAIPRTAGAAAPATLDLKVLLIGTGSSDPTTSAWASSLTSEGVPYTEVDATGIYGSETVTLPTLSSGTTGNFNGVVIADSPSGFAAGQLTALDTYESAFQVRQIDGYSYPNPNLGQTAATSGALDGTTATLTAAGLVGLPSLKGTIPFAVGTYGSAATVVAGSAFTPWIENSAGQSLGGVYQHPATDAQAGVAELSLNFDYNANQLQWLLLAPGLIDWVTANTHLGLYRNYFGQDVDDVFIADNEWSSTYQCTPAATEPPDYTCPAGVDNNPADTPPDVQMSAADVAYVVNWEKQTGITLNLAFNAVGACDAPTASTADCTGSVTDNGTGENGQTYTDPGFVADTTAPDDAAFVDALLGAKDSFNWMTHTWSHEFLGCNVWQPQALTSVTAKSAGGTFTAGTYSYEITAATAYGESEPSLPLTATVETDGSVDLSWPDATNGIGTAGNAGPTLAQEEAVHDPDTGTGFWGYNVYRAASGSTTYGLVGQVAENGTQPTYSYTDTGVAAGEAPGSSDSFPTATNPGIDCSSAAGSWDPAEDPTGTTDASIDTEIGLDQAFAEANSLPNYSPAIVVTGEHSGVESPNMPAALAAVGVTTFATDASRQSTPYTLDSGSNVANSAPRYPSNIYYNADNWTDELNEYNTLYATPTTSIGNGETGHCTDTSSTTCITAAATQSSVIASETGIMLSHVFANNPRVGYAHQANLIGSADPANGYTLLTTLSSMLSQYQSYTNANTPLDQMTDVKEAGVLADQSAWAKAEAAGTTQATETNGVITIANSGTTPVSVPFTAPSATSDGTTTYGEAYGGQLSDWTSLPAGQTLTLTEHTGPAFTSANAAGSIVGAPFTTTVTTTGTPAAAITETGALPAGITLVDNGNGTATISGTATAGTGGSYPITISATNATGTATQAFTLTNSEAPAITSASTASFISGESGTYTVTTTGFPAATITETGALPTGLTFTPAAGGGTATIAGTTSAVGTYPVTISATNTSGSTATLSLSVIVGTSAAPTITSAASAYFTLGSSGAVAVTTTGSPTPTVSELGALPAGLSFVANANGTALVSGTPSATGTTSLAITAANGVSPSANQTLTVIVGKAPSFTSAATVPATLGQPLSFSVTTSGYPAPSIGESVAMPAGLSFTDNGNGTATIAGTPTTAATTSVPLTAANAYGTASQSLSIAVSTASVAPAFTSAASASETVGTAFSFSVTTTGTPAASITESGTLPKGVTFTANGNGNATIAGTPTTAATSSITLTAKNANGTVTQTLAITVAPAPVAPKITSAASATATAGKAFTFSVTTTGSPAGTLTETGALPAGVTFTAAANGTATIAGTPATAVMASFTINAQNASGTATQAFTLTVTAAPVAPKFTSSTSATGNVGTVFTFSVTTTGSPAATITESGALPKGVSFTSNGNGTATITGNPTTAGTSSLTLTAKNASGTATAKLSIVIGSAPAFSSASSTTGTVGKKLTFQVTTTGSPSATLSESGTLPGGVTFAAKSGGDATISGSPTAGGTFTVNLNATNVSGSVNQTLTIVVGAPPVFTSSAMAEPTVGKAFSFTVVTSGSPTATLTETKNLPKGLTFKANADGTATISGTPTAITVSTVTISATNSNGTTKQTLSFIVL